MVRTAEQIISDYIIGKVVKAIKYDNDTLIIEFYDGSKISTSTFHDSLSVQLDADNHNSSPEFVSETEWRKENGHPFDQTMLDKFGKK
jgi:hypothetical protein